MVVWVVWGGVGGVRVWGGSVGGVRVWGGSVVV